MKIDRWKFYFAMAFAGAAWIIVIVYDVIPAFWRQLPP